MPALSPTRLRAAPARDVCSSRRREVSSRFVFISRRNAAASMAGAQIIATRSAGSCPTFALTRSTGGHSPGTGAFAAGVSSVVVGASTPLLFAADETTFSPRPKGARVSWRCAPVLP